MNTVFLALGSNVGDRKKHIEDAISLLQAKIKNIVQAPLYETTPVGYAEQENFYNTVIAGKTNLSPEALLLFIKSLEKQLGRKKRFKNGPREIDIDILLYDDIVLDSGKLIIPHPKMHERDFVLQPLADIAPNVIDPKNKKAIQQLLDELPEKERVILKKVQKI